jgi:hypothetical protein
MMGGLFGRRTDLPIFLTDTGYLKLDQQARFRKAGDFRNWHFSDMLGGLTNVCC